FPARSSGANSASSPPLSSVGEGRHLLLRDSGRKPPFALERAPAPMNTTKELARELQGKRVGVVLSAGYFGFFGHAGFIAALRGVGLEPAAYAGTSAGALVAALAASGLEPQEITARL